MAKPGTVWVVEGSSDGKVWLSCYTGTQTIVAFELRKDADARCREYRSYNHSERYRVVRYSRSVAGHTGGKVR